VASIDKRNGRWRARYRTTDGRSRSQTFARKVDAERFLVEVEHNKNRGAFVDAAAGRMVFAELAAAWLASNPAKRPTTYARDAMVIQVHLNPIVGAVMVAKLRPSNARAVVETMAARGLAPRTVQTNYGVLRAICSWAVGDDVIARTPCRGVRLPEGRRKSRPVASADDVRRLVDAMPVDYRVTVLLGALGLRQAEVFGLRVGGVDFLRRTLTVEATINEVEGRFVAGDGKTESSVRTISVPQTILDELAAHLARTGRTGGGELVVQAPTGGPVRATNFRLRIYNPAVQRAGLDGLTFHRLRHSAGHLMRELGVPLEVIQRRLGHRSIRTTADVYGSLPASVDSAVADRLGELLAPPRVQTVSIRDSGTGTR